MSEAQDRTLAVVKAIGQKTMLVFTTIFPFFFLPFTSDFFDLAKIVLVIVVATLVAVLWTIVTSVRKTVRVTFSPLTLPVLGFVIATLLSSVISSPNPTEALIQRGAVVAGLAALYIFGSQLLRFQNTRLPFLLLMIGGVIVTVTTFLQVLGIGPSQIINMIFGLQIPQSPLFNLTGSPLAAILFLLPVAIAGGVETFATDGMERKVAYAAATGVLIAGILLNGFFLLPGKVGELRLLPLPTGWEIALEGLKTPKTALLGVGPSSYLEAFTKNRPVEFNLLPQWNARYISAGNVYLHIFTTIGLFGLFSYLALIISSLRMMRFRNDLRRPFSLIVLTTFILQLILPGNLVQDILLFVSLLYLTLALKAEKDTSISDVVLHLFAVRLIAPGKEQTRKPTNASTVIAYSFSVVVMFIVAASLYFTGRAYAAESIFFRSLLSSQRNDATTTYNLQVDAIKMNPQIDGYHRAFSSTNFAIAKGISEKENVSEDEKQQISQLIQQSIEQAKGAVGINPQRTANWEALAYIYKNLINVAQGADQWSIAALVQAIETDPVNPALRLDLGGVYLTLKNLEQASVLFRQATELKPDWANAHYNLGFVYRERNMLAEAYNEFVITNQLLEPESADKAQLEKEIATLRTELEKQAKSETQTKTTQPESKLSPQTTQNNDSLDLPEGQIRIPEDLGLPEETPPQDTPASTSEPEIPEIPAEVSPSPSTNPNP